MVLTDIIQMFTGVFIGLEYIVFVSEMFMSYFKFVI